VSSPAQPDWYLGWLEGSLRLFPAWQITILGHTIPEAFLPGVLMPTIFFGAMFLWPFIERRITGDREAHHLLDRPRDAPLRTGIGAGVLAFGAILTLAGSNDVAAAFFQAPVEDITLVLRILILAVPPVAGYSTYRLCRGLQRHEEDPVRKRHRATLRRTAAGGFEEEAAP
jgi:ubiquinol-cytochrome c reductase cytochrome b subunit